MRRKDREVIEKKAQLAILQNAETVRIAFAVNNEPYIVAMSFGYIWDEQLRLYMHCAQEGKKLDMMRQNNKVCFQMDTDTLLILDPLECRWGMQYSSIIGRGTLSEITDENERFEGLIQIMKNYGKKGRSHFAAEILQKTTVLRLDVEELTAKQKK
jgi:uncharacterized protein